MFPDLDDEKMTTTATLVLGVGTEKTYESSP